jgi:hypothetical protein
VQRWLAVTTFGCGALLGIVSIARNGDALEEEQMSESERSEVQSPMTQVVVLGAGTGSGEVIGEFQSAGLRVGWNKAMLSQQAHAALHEILERAGGAVDRLFELRHGALVLLRCRLLGNGAAPQLSFDGSRRRRIG